MFPFLIIPFTHMTVIKNVLLLFVLNLAWMRAIYSNFFANAPNFFEKKNSPYSKYIFYFFRPGISLLMVTLFRKSKRGNERQHMGLKMGRRKRRANHRKNPGPPRKGSPSSKLRQKRLLLLLSTNPRRRTKKGSITYMIL